MKRKIEVKKKRKYGFIRFRKTKTKHITPEDYKRNLQHELLGYSNKKTLLLKNDAFPSLFLPKEKTTDSEEQEERTKRLQKRINKAVVNEILEGIREPLEEDVLDEPLLNQVKEKFARTEHENTCLKEENAKLKDELKKTNIEKNDLETKIRNIFTDGQIKKLKNPEKEVKWCEEDIAKSITVYATGARSYKLLLKKNFPFPSVRTLQR
ncbi:unnamed protein product [Hermetia illucens]|uniref:Uncharacterized protein n=1 Tax=Hermetia illucens TaxID=343691 RepID=A0A7R8UD83_HERIL|nr:unnamed protein product [Hermetia illucens]